MTSKLLDPWSMIFNLANVTEALTIKKGKKPESGYCSSWLPKLRAERKPPPYCHSRFLRHTF